MADASPDIKGIFLKALDEPSAVARAAYLVEACRDHPGALERVEALLGALEKAGSFLEVPALALEGNASTGDGSDGPPPTVASTVAIQPPGEGEATPADRPIEIEATASFDASATGPSPSIPTNPIAEGPGTRIGPYKLLQRIGEGGMGVVYMAEQEQPVRRRVALKVIKPGMDTAQVVARFEAERQALALMDHPNIARVLDAGATESGRPFFVMELVNGIPITEYCDQARLTPRGRLELFVPVCRAIQHAHQKGVIHRDIKPSNVMITLVDGRPTPRVIDFGVAKATGQRLTERSLFTQFGAIVGTLEYMSPEQAELSALDVDTRSDVFSLGVLLYELLTGSTPLERSRLREAGFAEILRRIREEEPPTPSTRLSGSGEALPSIAASRHMEPTRLARLVRGELDWIAMRALEKDRTRRYDSAGSLAKDVERYLADEAVKACPPSRRYRLGKFARKNRGALATAGAIAAILLAATAISMWQAASTREQRDLALRAEDRASKSQVKAEEEGARARRSAEKSRAVLEFFLQRVVAAARPVGQEGGQGHDVTLRAALDTAERGIAADFAAQPEVEAAVRRTLGEGYILLGDFAKAVEQLERVRTLSVAGIAAGDLESLELLENLAVAYMYAGRRDDAIRLSQETLELRKTRLGPDDSGTLQSLSNLAAMSVDAGRFDDAIRLGEQALRLRRAKLGTDHPHTLINMNNLAKAYMVAGRVDDAIRLNEQAIELQKDKLGPDHPETLQSLTDMAWIYQNAGRVDDAIRLNERTIELQKAKLGPDHPLTLTTLNNLSTAYQEVGRKGDAIMVQEGVLAVRKAKLGLEHPITLQSMNNLIGLYINEKRWAEAEAKARECLEQRKKAEPDEWPYFLTMSQLGAVLAEQAKYAEAEPMLIDGYQGLRSRESRIPATAKKYLATAAGQVVAFYEAWGKPEKAAEWRKTLGMPPAVTPRR